MEPAEKFELDHGVVVEIHWDDEIDDPRENWDHTATMLCWHSRSNLGDEQGNRDDHPLYQIARSEGVSLLCNICGEAVEESYGSFYHEDDEDSERELGMNDVKLPDNIVWLPLFLYEHSGMTMSTGAFSCPWDSGQVGMIFMDTDLITWDTNGKSKEEVAYEIMEQEVKEYDYYLTGQSYGYIIRDEAGENVDSCWGFLGEMSYCVENAMEAANGIVAEIAAVLASALVPVTSSE